MYLIFFIIIFLAVVVIFGSQSSKKDKAKAPTKPPKRPSIEKLKAMEKEKLAKPKNTKASIEEKNYKAYLKNFPDTDKAVKLSPEITSVAGVRYKNEDTGIDRQLIIRHLQVKEKLMLIPDKNNPYDEDAVSVRRLNGEQIGFLNKDLAIEIKARLVKGLLVETTVKKVFNKEGFLEVVIELVRYSRKTHKK